METSSSSSSSEPLLQFSPQNSPLSPLPDDHKVLSIPITHTSPSPSLKDHLIFSHTSPPSSIPSTTTPSTAVAQLRRSLPSQLQRPLHLPQIAPLRSSNPSSSSSSTSSSLSPSSPSSRSLLLHLRLHRRLSLLLRRHHVHHQIQRHHLLLLLSPSPSPPLPPLSHSSGDLLHHRRNASSIFPKLPLPDPPIPRPPLHLPPPLLLPFLPLPDHFSSTSGSIADALYFSVVTMCTIGYSDITPFSKLSAIFLVLFAFGFLDILFSSFLS